MSSRVPLSDQSHVEREIQFVTQLYIQPAKSIDEGGSRRLVQGSILVHIFDLTARTPVNRPKAQTDPNRRSFEMMVQHLRGTNTA